MNPTKRHQVSVMKLMILILGLIIPMGKAAAAEIPLPEHPRPDFMRAEWLNLNGNWRFSFDKKNAGLSEAWFNFPDEKFERNILVPFSWVSPASGINDKEQLVGWYRRDLDVPKTAVWKNKRIILIIGASDYGAQVWVNGKDAGWQEGGYIPLEFDITDLLTGKDDKLTVRVDELVKDSPQGKQSYGKERGIWQTVYLEARSKQGLNSIRFYPDIDKKQVDVGLKLSEPARRGTKVNIVNAASGESMYQYAVPEGSSAVRFTMPVKNMRLWSLADPYLYDVKVQLADANGTDEVTTYFGMRKVSTGKYPGGDFKYVYLNNEPIYLQMVLDQAYHNEGYGTYPTDQFMKEDVLRAKALGLNTIRTHIKVELPRKLYWADKLGMLIMADMVDFRNSPLEKPRRENAMRMWELTAVKQVERDFNHPSIFSWVLFNESWGLLTPPTGDQKIYLPETQKWVMNMYLKFKADDPTRLIDENSACKEDHMISDFNSWHEYLPGYVWSNCLDAVVAKTFPGSEWNYMKGYKQTDVPMINAECGGVWGYKNGSGDVDITYDYHQMINEFKRRPKIAGYLFTEFHDVPGEFNGYYRYNRTPKEFGLSELCPGMQFSDFASVNYVIPGGSFEEIYGAAQKVKMPVTVSFLERIPKQKLRIDTKVVYWNRFGETKSYSTPGAAIDAVSYSTKTLDPIEFVTPDEECVATYCTYLIDEKGSVLHRNFVPFRVRKNDKPAADEQDKVVVSKPAAAYKEASWSLKNLLTQQNSKFIGLGSGYVEYEFDINNDKTPRQVFFIAELSSRMNQSKYFSDKSYQLENFPNIGTGCSTWGLSPNSFPQTDEYKHPSTVTIEVDGVAVSTVVLPDDPADHTGLLSWFNQPHGSGLVDKQAVKPETKQETDQEGLEFILTKTGDLLRSSFYLDGKLDEPGSYGYLVKVELPKEAVDKLVKNQSAKVKLRVDKASDKEGGLSVFGKESGRYPLDPSMVLIY